MAQYKKERNVWLFASLIIIQGGAMSAFISSGIVAMIGVNAIWAIVPGFVMKMSLFFSRFVPDRLLSKITYNIQKKKDNN